MQGNASDIVINEVVSSNSRSLVDETLGSPDWIELYNTTGKDIDLAGYRLTDKSHSAKGVFSNTVIKAGGYLLVYTTKSGASTDSDACCIEMSVSKSGEVLELLNPQNVLVNQITIPALMTDESYARRDDGTYGYCTKPTPGRRNDGTGILDAGELKDTLTAGELTISEVQPKVLGADAWVELHNSGLTEINLGDYCLTTTQSKPYKWRLPEQTLKAGGDTVVCLSGQDKGAPEMQASFKLDNQDTALYLYDITGKLVSDMNWYPGIPAGISVVPGNRYTVHPTKGMENSKDTFTACAPATMGASDPVRINEVLPKNKGGILDGDGDRSEWVELFNSSDEAVPLAGYYLSDDKGNLLRWEFPDTEIGPKSYLVVFLSGKTGISGELHASFRLSSGESAVYLTNLNGMRVDTLALPVSIGENISVGRDEAGGLLYYTAPTPGADNGKGSSSLDDATEHPMDSSDPVRINEVLPKNKYSIMDGDGDRTAWVELYNTSAEPVSLASYYLSDNKDNLTKWAFPDTTIEANGYLIVFLSNKKSKPGELHAPFSLSEDEVSVYLTNLNGMRVDSLPLPKALGDNISVGRDGQGGIQYYAQPTPGSANAKGFEDPKLIGFFDKNSVYISEVSAVDHIKSTKNDWVELYNGSGSAVNLKGYYLSDDAGEPKKWQLPALTIAANGYTVIEASSGLLKQNPQIAAFGISSSGETLLLSNAQGTLIDAFDTGSLSTGMTSGRIEGNNAVERVYFHSPTRGEPNDRQYMTGYAAMPVFSDTSLYHSKGFSLSISCPLPNAKIYYTLNGSVPTKASTAYVGPISISKNTPVRAIAYADDLLPSQVNTATFLFDKPHTVPVFCISGEPKEMQAIIGSDSKNYKPEFAAQIEYHEADGGLGVAFPSGLRPKGAQSVEYPQNSMIIALRGGYGESSVTYPFFPDSSIKTYTTLTLRSSGQDYNASRMRDSYFQKVADGIDVDSIKTRTVAVYINGAYLGQFDLDEEQNEDYFASHFGINRNNVEMIAHDDTAMSGSNTEFLRIKKIAQTWNMADDKVFAEFAKYIDIDACTDYLAARTYFGDGDVINCRFWRTKDYSAKWRPLFFDLDFCLKYNDANRNVFWWYFNPTPTGMSPNGNGYPVTDLYIFSALRKNKAWCDKFVERYVQLAETQFRPDRMLQIFDAMKSTMQPEMAQEIAKWHTPGSMSAWQSETAKLRSALQKRQAIALRQVQNFFHVSDSTMQKYIDKYSS